MAKTASKEQIKQEQQEQQQQPELSETQVGKTLKDATAVRHIEEEEEEIPQAIVEEEKKSQATASVKDTPASKQSVKAPKVAKSEAQTTPAGIALSSSAAEIKELPRQPSIPEENMPKEAATVTEGNTSQAAMPRTESIPEENMPKETSSAAGAANAAGVPKENMPAADYNASADEANRDEPAPSQSEAQQ